MNTNETKSVNYQTLSAELDELLAKLQSNDVDVDQAVALYERGMAIIKQLEAHLKTAENKVTKIKKQLGDAA